MEWWLLGAEWQLSEELACSFSNRKLLLLGCACLRRVWRHLGREADRDAVEAAERYADGLLARQGLIEAWGSAEAASGERLWIGPRAGWSSDCPCCQDLWIGENERASLEKGAEEAASDPARWAAKAAFYARGLAVWAAPRERRQEAAGEEVRAQYTLLADLCAIDPSRFRVDPAWLRWQGGTVKRLARAISLGQGDAALALADALDEAGCDQSGLVRHLREPGPHVRGCWAADALLGKR